MKSQKLRDLISVLKKRIKQNQKAISILEPQTNEGRQMTEETKINLDAIRTREVEGYYNDYHIVTKVEPEEKTEPNSLGCKTILYQDNRIKGMGEAENRTSKWELPIQLYDFFMQAVGCWQLKEDDGVPEFPADEHPGKLAAINYLKMVFRTQGGQLGLHLSLADITRRVQDEVLEEDTV